MATVYWSILSTTYVQIFLYNGLKAYKTGLQIAYTIFVLAVIGAGGCFTGSNPAYTPNELAHHIKASEAKFAVAEPEILKNLRAGAKLAKLPAQNIWVFDNLGQTIPPGEKSWKELFSSREEDWVRFNDLHTVSDTTAARLFSSGTTGLPKAVKITHYNLIAQHVLATAQSEHPYEVKRLIVMPIFHASVAPVTHVSTLKSGHTAYVMRRFEMEKYLETVQKYEIPEISMVPPIVIAILMNPLSHKYPFLKKTRAAACGAAPLDKDVQARFRALMGDGSPFTQVWGMTETSCVATMFKYPEHDDTGSVGRLIPNLQAKYESLDQRER